MKEQEERSNQFARYIELDQPSIKSDTLEPTYLLNPGLFSRYNFEDATVDTKAEVKEEDKKQFQPIERQVFLDPAPTSFDLVYDSVADPDALKYRKLLTRIAKEESNFDFYVLNKAGAPAYGAFLFMDFNIPKGTSIEEFRNNPTLLIKEAARLAKLFESEFTKEDLMLALKKGYSKDALIAGAWLGGVGGVRKVLRGTGNPSDKHWSKTGAGTSVKDRMDKINTSKFLQGGTMNGMSPINLIAPISSLFLKDKLEEESTKEVLPKISIYADKAKKSLENLYKNPMNWDNLDFLHDYFTKNLGYKTSVAILSNIARESMGNPRTKLKGGPAYGLLLWEKDRLRDMKRYKMTGERIEGVDPELLRLAEYIVSRAKDRVHDNDWTHGGTGSKHADSESLHTKFISKHTPLKEKTRLYTLGFVRPKAGLNAAEERSKAALTIDSIYNPKFFPRHQQGGTILDVIDYRVAHPTTISLDTRTRELIDNNNTTYKRKKVGEALKNTSTSLRDAAGVAIAMLNPVAGVALGASDAARSIANLDYTLGGILAGLEILPYGIGKSKGAIKKIIQRFPKKSIGPKSYDDLKYPSLVTRFEREPVRSYVGTSVPFTYDYSNLDNFYESYLKGSGLSVNDVRNSKLTDLKTRIEATYNDYRVPSHVLEDVTTRTKGDLFRIVRLVDNPIKLGEYIPNRPLSFSFGLEDNGFGKNRLIVDIPKELSYLATGLIIPDKISELEVVLPRKLRFKIKKGKPNKLGGDDYIGKILNPYTLLPAMMLNDNEK